MLRGLAHITQPLSGEYEERIFDIESHWNSSEWSWISFEEDDEIWVGEFRGRFRGASFSEKLGIIVVLTADYLYILDLETKKITDYERMPQYCDITYTPFGDILMTDGYGLVVFKGKDISTLKNIVLPVNAYSLRFIGYDGNTLIMQCEELLNWDHAVRLFMDCASFDIQAE